MTAPKASPEERRIKEVKGSYLAWCGCKNVIESLDGTHNILDGEVVYSTAISNGPGSSEDNSICPLSAKTFRSWSN